MKTLNKIKQGLVLGFIILFTSSYANTIIDSNDPIKGVSSDRACLVIKGKFLKTDKSTINTYTMALIQENTVIETKIVKCGSSFQFKIGKGNWWAIKITGEGCVPKLYSINTNLPKEADEDMIYSLNFSASEPITEFESTLMDNDALDFPVAIFQFDEKLDAFNYNEEYTNNIMKKLFEGIKTNGN